MSVLGLCMTLGCGGGGGGATRPQPDTTAPGKVSDLAATSPTSTSVKLTWTTPGDDGDQGTAKQYDVRYSHNTIIDDTWPTATEVAGEPAPGAAGSEDIFTVTDLDPDTTYYFALKCADEVPNWSDLSNVVSGVTDAAADTTAPAAVTDLSTGSPTSSSITLTWTAPGDDGDQGTAVQYDVRFSYEAITDVSWPSASAVDGEPAPSQPGTAELFTVQGLDPDTTHHFALKCGDEVPNWSGLSNAASARTLATGDITPPADVTDLSAVVVTPSSVILTWTAPGDDGDQGTAIEYDFRYSRTEITETNWDLAAASTGEPAPGPAGTEDVFTVENLDSSTEYYFALKSADDVANWSDLSNVVSVTTHALPPDTDPPAQVTDLAITDSTGTSVTLIWTAPGDDGTEGTADHYDVRYSNIQITQADWASATEVDGEPSPAPAGSRETLVVTNLSPNSTYCFALRTSDDADNLSSVSNSPCAATNTPPEASFTVTPVSGTTTTSFEFNASGSSDAEDASGGLRFDWDWNNDGTMDHQETGVTAVYHTFADPGTYEVVLTVVDGGGLSDSDTIEVVVTDGIPPGVIDDLAVGTITSSSVQLTWTAPGDDGAQGTAGSYDLRYATQEITEGTWASATQVSAIPSPQLAGSSESFTVTDLREETLYYFAVKTADEIPNESALSNVVSATTESELQGPDVVLIPAGSYTMGDGEAYCGEDERTVTLTRDFHLGRYEVTNQKYVEWVQWAYDNGYVTATSSAVLDNLDGASEELLDLDDPDCEIQFGGGAFSLRDAGHGANGDHPAKEVTWYGAAAFCDWLSLREGLTRAYDHSTWDCNGGDPYGAAGYRLPTDAEWEYAAQYDDERAYPWGGEDADCSRANYAGCTAWTTPVGSYPGAPSVNGELLYDMAGNVWEWCNDYSECFLGTSSATDPVGPATGLRRVLRGGSWYFFTFFPRCAYRTDSFPYLSYTYIGFRVARTVNP